MSESKKCRYILKAKYIEWLKTKFSHPWNPKSKIHGVRLGIETELRRTGVNLATIPPGKGIFCVSLSRVRGGADIRSPR